ncbi:unnamed protein product [Lepeophtheirus salmonis]|uniref:(salmon louse) hypothetical protein n=1 Tax=Lepeophtheirus salmonis TaxID=72036 RepID=A0A7R8CP26_LEPSM|nr:unnamed protein product [Lepeophtheirus salmonis]CAF2878411.1 unnamed protein product [Lepeophtheirus salmonis]
MWILDGTVQFSPSRSSLTAMMDIPGCSSDRLDGKAHKAIGIHPCTTPLSLDPSILGVDWAKFGCLKNIALNLLSVFGLAYCCEQVFSHMKSVLSPICSR